LDCVLWLGRKKLPAKQDSVECCLIDMFSWHLRRYAII